MSEEHQLLHLMYKHDGNRDEPAALQTKRERERIEAAASDNDILLLPGLPSLLVLL